MAHRQIGQERLRLGRELANPASSLDGVAKLINWTEVARTLGGVYSAAKGESAWPRWRCSKLCCSLTGMTSRT